MIIKLVLCGLFLFIWGIQPTIAQTQWDDYQLDSSGDVGDYSTVQVDAAGRAHISYYDRSKSTLKYGVWAGTAFASQSVVTTATPFNHLVLTKAGLPRIIFRSSNYFIIYASYDGSTWSFETVELNSYSGVVSMVIDDQDVPHICYGTKDVMKYAKRDPVRGWLVQSVLVRANHFMGRFNSIALDSAGNPMLLFSDASKGELLTARWNGRAWQQSTVDTEGNAALGPNSLVLDKNDIPHVAYGHYNSTLAYAKWNGMSWVRQTWSDIQKQSVAIFINKLGNPVMAIGNSVSDVLGVQYAFWDGSQWNFTVVQGHPRPQCDFSVSLAMNQKGEPLISYYDVINGDLKIASEKESIRPKLRDFTSGMTGASFTLTGLDFGRTYRIQTSGDLTHWQDAQSFTATSSWQPCVDSTPATNGRLFYRIKAP